MEKNKTGKYLKYALGEIVLVVFGILIALQINNWNEGRKEKELEQSYYCLLLDDIRQDRDQVEKLKQLVHERIGSSNKAISEIQKDQSDATEVGVNFLLSIRMGKRTFDPNDATFQDIKSSGNLGIIKDKEILQKLNRYFKNVDGYSSTILANFELDFERIASFRNWFDIGMFNGNDFFYKDVFTEEIRLKLQQDLPLYIADEVKSDLYSTLVMGGLNNRRRLELLLLIEDEVEGMFETISKKCDN